MSGYNFEGDTLIQESLEGAELVMENGLFVPDTQFSTAVYLSLFGGNKNDSGKSSTDKEWWGNKIKGTPQNEKLRSRFQNIILGLPMTVKYIKEAEMAAEMDLQWLKDEKIADEIAVYGQSKDKNRFYLTVNIKKNKASLLNNVYSVQWGGTQNG